MNPKQLASNLNKIANDLVEVSPLDYSEIPQNDFGKAIKNAKKLFSLTPYDEIDKSTLKSRYIALMKKWHPDKNTNKDLAEKMTHRVSKAYALLLNIINEED